MRGNRVSGPGIVHPISAGDCLGEDAEKLVQRANGCRRMDHDARLCRSVFSEWIKLAQNANKPVRDG
jgi:hypothetical protein